MENNNNSTGMLNDLNNSENNIAKKVKHDDIKEGIKEIKTIEKVKAERCLICKQYSDEVLLYNGHPNNSLEEYITLTNERLMLFTGDEAEFNQHDERPTHKVTYFSVYDKNGHLCAFDGGLIEGNKLLYFSGYVKPVYDEDTSPTNGLPTKDMGPINEWFITGFDGGEKAVIGFSTAYAEYYLQEPSTEYQPIMTIVSKKILLAKLIIEFLLDEGWQNPTYEDLLQRLEATGDPEFNEETLLRHAQFICDRVTSFDASATNDESLLITAPCMRSLVKMAGVTFKIRQKLRKVDSSGIKRKAKGFTKATTTTLVRETFENFFIDQIDNKKKDDKGPRRQRCGVCESCQTPDCGRCAHCRNMLKFGGTGRSKQACLNRRCPYMAIQDANEESDNEEDTKDNAIVGITKILPFSKRIIHKVKWLDEGTLKDKQRTYYSSALVGDLRIEVGNHVMLSAEEPNQPLLIATVCSMWETPKGDAMFHAHLFCRGSDSVLGETSDPRELFLVDVCENSPLGSIVRKAKVEERKISKSWALDGGLDKLPPQLEDDGENFFYTKRYDSEFSRFVDIIEEPIDKSTSYISCDSCRRKSTNEQKETAIYKDGAIYWRDEVYKTGSAVFLTPQTTQSVNKTSTEELKENVNQETYPEFYRKPTENVKVPSFDGGEPFEIGLIEDITQTSKDLLLRVRKFYRPENTHGGSFLTYEKDLNYILWSDEVCKVSFDEVQGKCYLMYANEIDLNIQEWCSKGPYRFYFSKGYDNNIRDYIEVPTEATRIGYIGKGKGKVKGKSNKVNGDLSDLPPEWDKLDRPLQCMDVFAGCGGLSEGLHQAGIAETSWAIEKEPAAAHAFKLNNPDAIVYTEDCNELLELIMSNEDNKGNTRKLPKKGEVELLVGGPPCQGFSGMNRFNAGQYSLFKNSLIISYLSYCDYYRPKYFILENVRNFASFKRSMVLKLTLRCLLAIGYQVTFGILQAGSYGVPQTRRRCVIMAAAPGYVLPKYPEPQHAFNKKGCQLSVLVDDFKFHPGTNWYTAAPFRTITVRDSMSDLPDIKNGCNLKEMPYECEPISHFQKLMRAGDSDVLTDHICKEMSPLVEARMLHIPLYSSSDWRDLPNIVVRLSDGTHSNKLKYPYRMKKQNKTDPPHGVCLCATGKNCDPADRQFNTLIPWCLPHTADRHNHWSGLYGRLEWHGIFSTTVTNPEPMGKQGRVLHPEQNRVVSVRECARSQGFPDRYKFNGSILDKHRQVGNAVPPPLGCAIGKEILKAYIASKQTT